MSDDDIDPRDEALLRIGAELSAIRGELTTIRQALVDDAVAQPDSDDSAQWTCQHCGRSFGDEFDARDHAVNDHKAPPDHWRDSFTHE
jgi:hypothetical protein